MPANEKLAVRQVFGTNFKDLGQLRSTGLIGSNHRATMLVSLVGDCKRLV
jgi:hypothetical protein